MKCPTDGATLTMSERGGIEIDYCPECRGVWLDRGELDKIIERAGAAYAAAPPPPPPSAPRERYDERPSREYDREPRYDDDRYRGRRKKKDKFDFLEDLFDF